MAPGAAEVSSFMKNKSVFSLLAVAAAALASPRARADPESASGARPALRIDHSPVTDGKAPAVTSYADVIEPVEKAVVWQIPFVSVVQPPRVARVGSKVESTVSVPFSAMSRRSKR